MYHRHQAIHDRVHRGQSLVSIQSPYQTIEFDMTNKGLGLFLNDEMQFVEQYERIYHHALAGTPFNLNPLIQKALILGGGDGLAARTILDYKPNASVVIAELDPLMIHMCQRFLPMINLNKGSLHRTTNVIDDAQKTIRKIPNGSVDLVICDFPDRNLGTLSLYGPHMYSEIFRVLKKDGVVSAYTGGVLHDIMSTVHNQFGNHRVMQAQIDGFTKCPIIQGVKTCLP